MKERIYSIPLTDALNDGCGCIMCTLEKKLEDDACEYFLGPSLMEPDNREITNDKGFCRRHLPMLVERGNRLGLALMLETHVKELAKKINPERKGGFLSKGYDVQLTSHTIMQAVKSCALCDKLNSQIKDAAGNLAYLWDKEEDFRTQFEKKGALCPEHAAVVLSVCEKELSSKNKDAFIEAVATGQKKQLDELYDALHEFTLSFDYRNNSEKPSERATASVSNTLRHLAKY